jgi:hypothetical protein
MRKGQQNYACCKNAKSCCRVFLKCHKITLHGSISGMALQFNLHSSGIQESKVGEQSAAESISANRKSFINFALVRSNCFADFSRRTAVTTYVRILSRLNLDRCYDFWNIFAEKFSKKIGVFDSKQGLNMQNFDHNIGIWEKRQFFRQKLSKIAENCDHNIDPSTDALVSSVIYILS